MTITKRLRQALSINPVSAAFMRARTGSFIALPTWGTHVWAAPGSRSKGPGKLLIGAAWPHSGRFPSQFVIREGAELVVNGAFKIHSGCNVSVNEGATLVLGSGFTNTGLNLACYGRIEIGENVAISENVTIRDDDGHQLDGSKRGKPIRIGNKVWIGLNATILKGVTVGDGAVIAAGAVVTRDVPPRTLAAGVPARVIRENVNWH